MSIVPAKLVTTLAKVIELFVAKEYEQIEQLTGGVRLTAQEISHAISEYDAELVLPPSYNNLDAIFIDGSSPKSWSVRFDLWTKEEGQSDLSLEATLIDSDNDLMKVELDNLHVL